MRYKQLFRSMTLDEFNRMSAGCPIESFSEFLPDTINVTSQTSIFEEPEHMTLNFVEMLYCGIIKDNGIVVQFETFLDLEEKYHEDITSVYDYKVYVTESYNRDEIMPIRYGFWDKKSGITWYPFN